MTSKLKPATVRKRRSELKRQLTDLRRELFSLQDRCSHEWEPLRDLAAVYGDYVCTACGKERDWRRS